MESKVAGNKRKRLRRLHKQVKKVEATYSDEDMETSRPDQPTDTNQIQTEEMEVSKSEMAHAKKIEINSDMVDSIAHLDEEQKEKLVELVTKLSESQQSPKESGKSGKVKKSQENVPPNLTKSRRKRLDKLAKKMAEGVQDEEELEDRKAKKMIENYALGLEDDEEDAPDPKDVAKELDNDSLYCKEESDHESSGDESADGKKNGKKKRKTQPMKKKGVIKIKNKLFDDIYESDSGNSVHIRQADIEELQFEESEPKQLKELNFAKMLKNKNKTNGPVFLTNIWKRLSNNELAERGFNLKLNVKDILHEKTKSDDKEGPKLPTKALALPEYEIED